MRLASIALLAATVPSTAPDPAVVERLREVGREQQNVTTLRAHFVQEKRLSILREVLRSSGTFKVDTRGRVAWDVAEPEPIRIVISERGVFAGGRPVAGGLIAELSPFSAFRGFTELFAGLSEKTLENFEVTLQAHDRFRMVPRSKRLKTWVSAVEITLDAKQPAPRKIRLEEAGGDVTEIVLTELVVNPKLDDSAFEP